MALKRHFETFWKSEDGWISILSIYFVVIAAIMGGLAIDFQNRTVREIKLQTAADAVAHAALYSRTQQKTPDEAREIALAVAQRNLPTEIHGNAITEDDIQFGTWDEDYDTFTESENAIDAVRVFAKRNVARDNIVKNLLLDIVGYSGWEVEVEATFEIWYPPCFQNGFTALNVVDTQSNNVFGADFCMHANDHVKLSSNNTFYAGSVVSMPDTADLQLPSSGMESNYGLMEALRNSWYQFKVLDEFTTINNELRNGSGEYSPDFISSAIPITITEKNLDPTYFTPNRIHIKDCSTGGKNVTLKTGDYSNFVFITDCDVSFGSSTSLEDVVIYSESTGGTAFSAPSDLRIGRDDNCADGGGVTLITNGGFDAAANLEIYGSQIMAKGDIEFAAKAEGVQGVSMIAGGDVDTTSNVQMNGCPNQGDENLIKEKVIRMVK